jgi:hypothetical protein
MRHAQSPARLASQHLRMSNAPTKAGLSRPKTVHQPAALAHPLRSLSCVHAGFARFPRGAAVAGLLLAAVLAASSSGCMNNGSQNADAGVTNPPRCVAPEGAPTSPQTIADVVALVNALPSPVTLPCFLQTLARPLKMHASVSLISAQPSAGARSPRIFLFFEGLRLSIVPAGAGAPLLELGEIRDESRSLKAEILFPVTTPLDAAMPYDRILFTPTVTRCGFCHPVETPDPDISFATAFTSVALRPLDSYAVTIDALANELSICDPTAEPDRCAMLHALFDQGTPVEQPFPAELPTIQ